MDEEIANLRRGAASNPADEAAARRLDAALRRGGRPAEVADRFRMKFACERRWRDLSPTSERGVKFCASCDRQVHAVTTVDALRENVARGHCVAFPSTKLAHVFEGLAADERLHSASEPRPPCVVREGVPVAVPEELRALIPADFARRLRVVPIAIDEDRLLVAVDVHESRNLIDDLELMTGKRVQAVRATDAELDALLAAYPLFEPADSGMTMGIIEAEENPVREAWEQARPRIDASDFAGAAAIYARAAAEALGSSPADVAGLLSAQARALVLAGGAVNASAARNALESATRVDSSSPYPRLWLAALFGHLAPLDALRERSDWPGPLARCLARQLSARDLIAEASARGSRRVIREQLCEAYGFLGTRYDTRGQTQAARQLYEQCIAQGVEHFVEHQFATARLRLDGPAPWRT